MFLLDTTQYFSRSQDSWVPDSFLLSMDLHFSPSCFLVHRDLRIRVLLLLSLWIFRVGSIRWFSLKYKWQQVSSTVPTTLLSILADLSSGLESLNFSSDFKFSPSLFSLLGNCSKCSDCDWYYCLLHIHNFFFFFCFLIMSKYFSSFSLYSFETLWSVGRANSTCWHHFFSFFTTRFGFWTRLGELLYPKIPDSFIF